MTENVYLQRYLAPLRPFLARSDVTDIYINRPGELWIEAYGEKPERHEVPALTEETLRHFVQQVAAFSAQGISREHPLLAASLPSGDRIQVVMPPATRGEIAIAIRKHNVRHLTVEDFFSDSSSSTATRTGELLPGPRAELAREGLGPASLLRKAVRDRRTILISGGTSTGRPPYSTR